MLLASIGEMVLAGFTSYKCYFLAYGGQPKEVRGYTYVYTHYGMDGYNKE